MMDIEQATLLDLKPHPSNPRLGDVEAIKESVRLHGVYRPVIVSQDGVILAGHHLVQALLELEHTTVPIVRLPIQGDSVGAAKIVLADNRTADLARYDEGLLLDMLTQLEGDLYGTAWTQQAVDDLVEYMTDPEPFDPPQIPEVDSDLHNVTLTYSTDDYIAFLGLVDDAQKALGAELGDAATVLMGLRMLLLTSTTSET